MHTVVIRSGGCGCQWIRFWQRMNVSYSSMYMCENACLVLSSALCVKFFPCQSFEEGTVRDAFRCEVEIPYKVKKQLQFRYHWLLLSTIGLMDSQTLCYLQDTGRDNPLNGGANDNKSHPYLHLWTLHLFSSSSISY